jgi:hypothetical protein
MGIRRKILAAVLVGSSLTLVSLPTLAQVRKTVNPVNPMTLTLESEAFQPFSALKQSAMELAQQSVEQWFRQNPQAADVVVTIIGDRNGQLAPILTIAVTREQWQQTRNIAQWARIFDNAEILLGFREPMPNQPGKPLPAGRGGIAHSFPKTRSPLISQGLTSRRGQLEGIPGFRDD